MNKFHLSPADFFNNFVFRASWKRNHNHFIMLLLKSSLSKLARKYWKGELRLKEVLGKVVDAAVELGAEYVEVRGQKLSKSMVTLKEGRVEAAKQGLENGAALRVLMKGTWGFASVGALDVETLTSAVTDACRMAKAASARRQSPIKLVPTETVEDEVVLKPGKDRQKSLLKTK